MRSAFAGDMKGITIKDSRYHPPDTHLLHPSAAHMRRHAQLLTSCLRVSSSWHTHFLCRGMAEVLSAISTLGQQGGYKGHLRSLSKSKAKRGPRGELAASQQGPLIPGGARALLGGRQTPVQGTPPPGHGSSSTVASARSTPLSLGALGAATAGAAQVRGAEQARLLLQRVRAMQARSSSGSSEDSWN
jgi:hypothetical protein